MSITHPLRLAPVPPARPEDEALMQANAAHARAMPLARLLDNGMRYADAQALHALAAGGVPWEAAGEWLGTCNRMRAARALRPREKGEHLLAACACYRFAQSVHVSDNAGRRRLYRQVVDSFAEGVALLPGAPEKLEVETPVGRLCGWLFQPPGPQARGVVVIFGGADGWRESYYSLSPALLAEGLAVCLLDGPGQGESRLFHGAMLTAEYARGFQAVAAALKARFARVGLWGNSLGGTLAVGAALGSAVVDAVCSNGGSAEPMESADKFPRMLGRIAAMAGSEDPEQGRALLRALSLRDRLPELRCPLLVLHGAEDALFSLATAQPLHDLAGSGDKEMQVWDDGEHCLYTRAAERNLTVAGWFVERLG